MGHLKLSQGRAHSLEMLALKGCRQDQNIVKQEGESCWELLGKGWAWKQGEVALLSSGPLSCGLIQLDTCKAVVTP